MGNGGPSLGYIWLRISGFQFHNAAKTFLLTSGISCSDVLEAAWMLHTSYTTFASHEIKLWTTTLLKPAGLQSRDL